LKGLHDLSLVNSIEAIYSGSVGSINAAYLLSGQAEIGPTIYFEDLQKGFIFPLNLFIGTFDLIINRFIKRIKSEEAHNVVDIDYVYDILKNKKPLNLNTIKNNPINFYVKVLNLNTGEAEYKSFKDHPNLELLKAAITIKPYFFKETTIDGEKYVDGTIKEPLGINYLLNAYPDRKIVVILNGPIKRGLRHHLENLIEGIVSSLYPYKISLFKIFLKREGLIRADINTCLQNERILLLNPNFSTRARPRSTKPYILKETFGHGKKDSEKILSFIKNS
jgi:predicted patatin/cPLA2 family phospholipase